MRTTEIEKTDLQAIDKIVQGRAKIKKRSQRLLLDRREVIDDLLIALFARDIVCLWECQALQKRSS